MDQQDSFPCTEEAQANYLSEQGCVTCLVYYGRSIKEKKGNVSDAQKVVQAILKHSMSADRKPSHAQKEKHIGVAGRETRQGNTRLPPQ